MNRGDLTAESTDKPENEPSEEADGNGQERFGIHKR